MIRFQCQCGRLLDVDDTFAGRQVRCPACKQVALVPSATSPEAPTVPAVVPAGPPLGGDFVGTGLPPMSQRDLLHERHIRAIAFWDCLVGALMILGSFCGMGGTGVMAMSGGGAAAAAMGIMSILYMILAGAFFAVGFCLWKYHGWARWVVICLCALQVLSNLRGLRQPGGFIVVLFWLAWTGAMLWALLSPNAATICSPSYRQLVAQTPYERVAFWTSPFFWIPIVLFVAACGLMALVVGSIGFSR